MRRSAARPCRAAATRPIAWTGSTWTAWAAARCSPKVRDNAGRHLRRRVGRHATSPARKPWPIRCAARSATLADARAYTPPDPDAPHRLGKLPDLVARYKGRRAICFHHRAAFMWSAYLMGIDNMLMNFLAEPELVELVMDKVLALQHADRPARDPRRGGGDHPGRRLRQQPRADDEPRACSASSSCRG